MNITIFSLLLNRYPIWKAKKYFEKIKHLKFDELNQLNIEKRTQIVEYHRKHTSFYKEKTTNDWEWDKLPVLKKQDIQIALKERLSNQFTIKQCYTNKTSGSTGDPFYFAKDKFSHALTWVNIEDKFNTHSLFGKKQARFYGLPKDKIVRYKERIKDYFSNRYRFDVFDLSNEALESWLVNFTKNKYVYINGYTTVIVVFAKFLLSKKITLKSVCPSLKACVVTSEMCSASDRKTLEEAFGVRVINEYGASELDLIAFEDENFDWVINNETLFVEILDDNNLPVEFGEKGKIVISSLYNKAHPFIRYEIGDIGVLQKKGNKIILKELVGRKEDLIYLPSGKVAPGLTFYYVTKSIMEDTDNIKEIKVVQTKINEFEIEYTSKEILKENQIENIKTALLSYLEPNLKLNFKRLEKLERSKSGKLKQFKSLL